MITYSLLLSYFCTGYDWYTWERAVARLDEASVDGFRNLAFALAAAARSGALEAKWGGIFGMEFINAALGASGIVVLLSLIISTPPTTSCFCIQSSYWIWYHMDKQCGQ